MKKNKLLLILVCLILVLGFRAGQIHAQEASWLKSVDYLMMLFNHYEEDYSRLSPPYKRHIKLYFEFKNVTTNKLIVGIEFRARFFDAFGDLIHETENLKLHTNLNPGDTTNLNSYWYYEDTWPLEGPYSRLAPLIMERNIQSEVAVCRIAFSDGQVLSFDKLEWVRPQIYREVTKRTFKPAFLSLREQIGSKQSNLFSITTNQWKISYVVFTPPENSRLTINIFSETGSLVKSETIDLNDVVNIGDIVLSGNGNYYLEVKGEGNFNWTVNVHESN